MAPQKPRTSPFAAALGNKKPRSLVQLGFISWCVLLVFLNYGSALDLPLFFDDFVHLPFVESHTFSEIWRAKGQLPYYRPVNFAIWRLTYTWLGYHSPTMHHALNLGLHLANGVMVGWLAKQLWSRNTGCDPVRNGAELSGAKDRSEIAGHSINWWRAYLSAALFILFPFSYQAVPWIGALSHLLVTFFILLTLVFYLHMRRSRRYFFAGMSLLSALFALFTHENGIMIGPFIAAIEFTNPDGKTTPLRSLRRALIWMSPLLIWLPIWATAPKTTSGSFTNIESLWQNAAYFFQGIAYPFTRLGGWLRDSYNLNDMVTAAALSLLSFSLIGLIQRLTHASRRALLPWFWCGIAILPAILFLSFDYVIDGPRLLMAASVGISWLWTDLVLRLFDWQRLNLHGRRYGVGLATFLTLIILIPSQEFIRIRMNMHQVLGAVYSQAVEKATQANAAGNAAIFINLPSWFAPRRPAFALGHEGVLFWPAYAIPESLVGIHKGVPAKVSFVRIDAIVPEMSYIAGMIGGYFDWSLLEETPAQLLVPRYSAGGGTIEPVGIISTSDLGSSRGLASFTFDVASSFYIADEPATPVTLLQAEATVMSPTSTEIRLVWSVQEMLNENVTVFVHLVDDQGQLVGQADGDPLGGSLPLNQWPSHSLVEEMRWIEMGDTRATLVVGLYHRATGERLLAISPSGEPWPENAVSIKVKYGE